MPLHPEIRGFLEKVAELNLPAIQTLSPAEARAQMEQTAAARNNDPTPVANVEALRATGPHGDIPLRLYRASTSSEPQPLLVYFHGGGHVIGSLDTHDAIARNLCAGAGCAVASVDYRMGPEHKFPAAYDDCVAATRWLADNAGELGFDTNRIAVGGDSAGGNLAAVVALNARDEGGPALCYQLLVYPVTDYRCSSGSYERYATGYGVLEAQTMRWFQGHYLGSEEDQSDWRASPLLTASLSNLPAAMVMTAECDVLHDEGVAYADALKKAGNQATHVECAGMIHGFFGLAPTISSAVQAQATAASALREAFGQ